MKIIVVILFACASLAAETKTEAELKEIKRQNAALQAALAAERAEKATLKAGTQKLTEAVRDSTETTGAKVEAAASQILESQASGVKAVERVAAETKNATKKLADVVTNQQTAVTSAITAQTRQLDKSLAQARDDARRLLESNRELAKTAEENRIAKEENAKQLSAVRADLKEMKVNQAIAAAKDDTALRMQRYKLISDLVTPLIQGVCGILLALVVVFQIKATRQASATHKMVNGERAKMLQEIEDLKKQNQSSDRENGHPST